MNVIENALPGEWIYALGWTVLHSFWQAALVALVVGLLLLRMQQKPAWQRYWVAHVGWFSIIICAGLTFLSYYHPEDSATLATITRLTPEGEAVSLSSPSLLGSYLHLFKDYFNEHLPLVVSLWILGMTFFLLRFLGGLIFLQHLRSHKVQAFSPLWENRVLELRKQLGLKRPVQLLESALVKVPMVIGWIKPVILLPIGAVNALSPQQIEAILAHELAHIKRHDYLLNIIRSLVEVLFYFNPAVWWLSAQIRTEREHCCDDMALAVCGDSLSYVRALVALQELSQRPGIGLAMTFVRSKPELLNRVRRILNQPKDKSDLMEKLMISCLLLLMLSFTLVSAGLPNGVPESGEVEIIEVIGTKEVVEGAPSGSILHLKKVKLQNAKSVLIDLHSEAKDIHLELDTIPGRTMHLKLTQDGKYYDVRIKEDKIERLSINGKLIPKQELVNYYDLVQNLLDDMPVPPPPPAPDVLPVKPPTPPSAPVAPKPSKVPSSPTPPSPPSPPVAPAAVAPPPPPPPEIQIRLKKPAKGEGGTSQLFEVPEKLNLKTTEPNHFEWASPEDQTKATVWVTKKDNNVSEKVIVVRVNKEEETYEEDQHIVVEAIANDMDQKATNFTASAAYEFKADKTVTFFRTLEKEIDPSNNTWQKELETKQLTDDVLNAIEHYEIEISGDQLLINGEARPEVDPAKYLLFYQKALDRPLEKDELHFFNYRTKRRME